MTDLFFILTFCAALGCGLMAGVLFAFSTFVMRALARLQPALGIEAMQSINRTAINPLFMGGFLGTAAMSLVLGSAALWSWDQPSAVYQVGGSLLYFVGTFAVTVVFNVPMNNALETVGPTDSNASEAWDRYCSRWTTWNHVRTVAGLLAAASLTLALWVGPCPV